jgi:hypothetical protein
MKSAVYNLIYISTLPMQARKPDTSSLIIWLFWHVWWRIHKTGTPLIWIRRVFTFIGPKQTLFPGYTVAAVLSLHGTRTAISHFEWILYEPWFRAFPLFYSSIFWKFLKWFQLLLLLLLVVVVVVVVGRRRCSSSSITGIEFPLGSSSP